MFELLYIHNWIPPLLQKGQKLLKFSYLEGGKFFARKAGCKCERGVGVEVGRLAVSLLFQQFRLLLIVKTLSNST